MKRNNFRLTLAICSFAAWTLTIAGCPLPEPEQAEFNIAVQPGSHYVEDRDGKLHYYRLSDERGMPGEWVELIEDGAWFEGPGFYQFDDQASWSPDESAAGLTLDEFIQLYDPAPTPQ